MLSMSMIQAATVNARTNRRRARIVWLRMGISGGYREWDHSVQRPDDQGRCTVRKKLNDDHPMDFPTPGKFEEAVAAVFSGSRLMRLMMPPLLVLSSIFCFLAALAGFIGEDGIAWPLALGGLSWGIILLFAAYASLRPHNTGWIQGIFALHLAIWIGFWAYLLLPSDPKQISDWVSCLFLILFAVGAASYGISCFRYRGIPDPADGGQASQHQEVESHDRQVRVEHDL